MIYPIAVIAAAGAGCGILLLIRALAPNRRVASLEAIHRLQTAGRPVPARRADLAGRITASRTIASLATGRAFTIPRTDLALLATSPEQYVAYRLGAGCIGVALGPIIEGFAVLAGISSPVEVPAAVSVIAAAVLFFASAGEVTTRATRARREASYQLLALLDLTALEVAGASSPLQAVEQAASALDAWFVRRVRATLTRAQVGGHAPWDGLETLGRQVAITPLTEAAGMLRAADAEGAGAHARLTARADALRAELQANEEATANTASERMVLPMTALVMVFILLVLYPLLININ